MVNIEIGFPKFYFILDFSILKAYLVLYREKGRNIAFK